MEHPTTRLHQASAALGQQLAHLQAQPISASTGLDLSGLLTALGQYEQAVLACLPPAPVDIYSLTPEQLRAYRETDPVYRLGWVRGHKAGLAQGQRSTAPVLDLYAQHAALPAPADPTALIQQVSRFLTRLHECYGAGPLTAFSARRPA